MKEPTNKDIMTEPGLAKPVSSKDAKSVKVKVFAEPATLVSKPITANANSSNPISEMKPVVSSRIQNANQLVMSEDITITSPDNVKTVLWDASNASTSQETYGSTCFRCDTNR